METKKFGSVLKHENLYAHGEYVLQQNLTYRHCMARGRTFSSLLLLTVDVAHYYFDI